MNVIYKYPLMILAEQFIAVPVGAKALSVKVKNGHLYLWVLHPVKTDNTKFVDLEIRIFGTGFAITDGLLSVVHFLSTVFLQGHVWHVFVKGSC